MRTDKISIVDLQLFFHHLISIAQYLTYIAKEGNKAVPALNVSTNQGRTPWFLLCHNF
jgi:hypothetical protein